MATTSRRARVMARSRKLGHCICNPRQACPCEGLLARNVCQCAGERLEEAAAAVALTQLVKSPGCASKVPPGELARILARLPAMSDPRLLVGSATADDAGVFRIAPDLCLVQTVDLFTPCVDDPYTFGRIAACNSVSDVYAMGGTPVTALSIIGYPVYTVEAESVCQMLRGGCDQLAEAGVTLVGGHSVNEGEIKLGFAVTGVVQPAQMITNAGAEPGDALILTKPIGTGIVAFAAQLGRASPGAREAAAVSMTTLNRAAAEIMVRFSAHACTDVTGFGLLGHLSQIARESAVSAEVWWETVPLLPEARAHAEQGLAPGAAERNREYVDPMLRVAGGVPEAALDLLCDPQTSGGLLFAMPAATAAACVDDLRAAGCEEAAIIGRVTEQSEGRLIVTQRTETAAPAAQAACCAAAAETCCGEQAATGPAANGPGRAFEQFMAAAFRPGALDVVQKELITIALSVAVQCEPCLKTHLAKAVSMGLSVEEIGEAAWLGVGFGGAKAMMLWKGLEHLAGNKERGSGV